MANGGRVTLAENADADGSAKQWPGGRGVFMAEATWGGGSATLQTKSPNGTWLDVDGASLSANGTKFFDMGPCEVRVAIATATAVYAYAAVAPR